ncbi:MAG: hypothetical protein Kow0025_14490 [Thermodesulfovibrionales bacterium]
MRCPHLVRWVAFRCRALPEPYAPTPFQLEEYCMGDRHRRCPLLFAARNIQPV